MVSIGLVSGYQRHLYHRHQGEFCDGPATPMVHFHLPSVEGYWNQMLIMRQGDRKEI